MNKLHLIFKCSLLLTLCISSVRAAVMLDHSRIIYDEGVNSLSINLRNNSKSTPYLLQSWIEDKNGNKKSAPFMVIPPVQRIEADESTSLRINPLAETGRLPDDIESLFYLNVREIPPKNTKKNVVSFALQTKIKIIYRPKKIRVTSHVSEVPGIENLTLTRVKGNLIVSNPTPYWITFTKISDSSGKTLLFDETFKTSMVAPHEKLIVRDKFKQSTSKITLTYINDVALSKDLKFTCQNDLCKVNN